MEPYNRDFLISRIDAGYLRYKINNDLVLRIYPPSKDILYEAQELFLEVRKQAYLNGALTKEEIFDNICQLGVWTETMAEDFKTLPKNIEILKVKLYENKYKSNLRKQIRKYLSVSKQGLQKLFNIRHAWDYLSCDGIAANAKMYFIIKNSTFINDKLYDWNTVDPMTALMYYNTNSLTESQIRELARNDPWIGMWNTRKNGIVFPEPMTTEQRLLVSWSLLYDSVQQSMDFPGEHLLEDDDMLDGWLILQRKNKDSDFKDRERESLTKNSKISNADEIFVPVDSIEDAKKIADLNDLYGQRVRLSREKQLNKEKIVRIQDFNDIKQKKAIQRNQAYGNVMKGGQ